MRLISYLITLSLLLMPMLQVWADSNDLEPYVKNPQSEFEISQDEYDDLKTYMQRAKEALERTLYDAHGLSGDRLYQRLMSGMQAALQESALRQDLVLFRIVLTHALDLDKIFMPAKAISARHVLLPHIQMALKYYQSDDLRVQNNIIHSADWAKFSADQILVLLRMASLAPDDQAKIDIVKYALVSTARALNSSFDRRGRAQQIVPLAEMSNSLKVNPSMLPDAQQLLLNTLMQLDPAQDKEIKEFPIHNYPASPAETIKPRVGPIFPLLSSTQKMDQNFIHLNHSYNYEAKIFARSTFEVGSGGTIQSDGGSSFTPLNARISSLVNEYGPNGFFGTGGDFKAAIGASEGSHKNVPLYDIKAQGWGYAGFNLIGMWVAVEAHEYAKFSEELVHLGWNTSVPIRIGENGYILLRLGIGRSWAQFHTGDNVNEYQDLQHFKPQQSDWTVSAGTVIRLAKFFINIDFTDSSFNSADWKDPQDPNSHTISTRMNRWDLSAALTIPLGMVFPNDAIRLDGSITQLNRDLTTDYGPGNGSEVTSDKVNKNGIFKLGAIYELEW